MKLKIEIAMDNAAFGDTVEDRAEEVGNILYDLHEALYRGLNSGTLRDTNGNPVCKWDITGESEG